MSKVQPNCWIFSFFLLRFAKAIIPLYHFEKRLSDGLKSNHNEMFAAPNAVKCFPNPGSQTPFMFLQAFQMGQTSHGLAFEV
jgi:hypothetical protein